MSTTDEERARKLAIKVRTHLFRETTEGPEVTGHALTLDEAAALILAELRAEREAAADRVRAEKLTSIESSIDDGYNQAIDNAIAAILDGITESPEEPR